MQTKNTHWPSILILIVLGTSVLFVFLFIAATGISSIIDLFSESGDPAGEMISTFAFGFELLVLLVCMWFVFQKAQSREQADLQFKLPFANWQILAVLGLIGLSVMLGAAVIYTEVIALAWVVLPFLTLLVIVPPIWIFFGLGTKGIDFGSRWRVFSILGLGMTLAPVTMIVLELIILFVIIIAGTVFLALSQPDLLQEVAAVGRILQNETDQDVILNLVAPYLSSPAVIATLIGYIGFIVPLIEELLKPLGVWLFARKFTSPAQGFAMGMLSGGAFALVESLNASGNGSAEWVVVVSVRAGTSLLHMVASGLVGWGIVSAFQERRYLRLPAAYFCAVAIHGLWNSCAIGMGISSVGESLGRPEWLAAYAPSMLGGLVVLGVGMFVVLLAANRKLSSAAIISPTSPAETRAETEEKVK